MANDVKDEWDSIWGYKLPHVHHHVHPVLSFKRMEEEDGGGWMEDGGGSGRGRRTGFERKGMLTYSCPPHFGSTVAPYWPPPISFAHVEGDPWKNHVKKTETRWYY